MYVCLVCQVHVHTSTVAVPATTHNAHTYCNTITQKQNARHAPPRHPHVQHGQEYRVTSTPPPHPTHPMMQGVQPASRTDCLKNARCLLIHNSPHSNSTYGGGEGDETTTNATTVHMCPSLLSLKLCSTSTACHINTPLVCVCACAKQGARVIFTNQGRYKPAAT